MIFGLDKKQWMFFLFCFCINFLWFMDCFVVLLLAMTKGQAMVNFFVFLWMNKKIVVCRLLRRFTPRNDGTHTSSLRGFEKAVAISVWDTGTVKQNSSLRELLATRGNLIILGLSLWEFVEVVAIHKKLKIENWKLKHKVGKWYACIIILACRPTKCETNKVRIKIEN